MAALERNHSFPPFYLEFQRLTLEKIAFHETIGLFHEEDPLDKATPPFTPPFH